ncbi:MAG: hypothetical protein ACKOW1_05400 [Novosphingobium sp.]
MLLLVVNNLRELEGTTGARLVTTELEIISVLYHEGPLSVQELMGKVRASSSGFHLIKKSMQDAGLIAGCKADHDARVKLLDLSTGLRDNLTAIYADHPSRIGPGSGTAAVLAQAGQAALSHHA